MSIAADGSQMTTPPPPATEPLPEAVATTLLPDASTMETESEKAESPVPLFHTSTDGMSALSAEGLPAASHVMGPVAFEPPA